MTKINDSVSWRLFASNEYVQGSVSPGSLASVHLTLQLSSGVTFFPGRASRRWVWVNLGPALVEILAKEYKEHLCESLDVSLRCLRQAQAVTDHTLNLLLRNPSWLHEDCQVTKELLRVLREINELQVGETFGATSLA